jgi:hypothetical protein
VRIQSLSNSPNFEYIRLETTKMSGQVVPMPVWFVVEDGMLHVHSYANSGTVKRKD